MKQADLTTINGRIRQVRIDHGLTQQEMADALGSTTRVTLNAMEIGMFLPTIETLRKVHQRFNRSYKWLIDGIEEVSQTEYEKMKRRIEELETANQELRENNKMLRGYVNDLKNKKPA